MARLFDRNYFPEDRREPPDLDYCSDELDEEETAWAYEDEDPRWDYYDGDDELDEFGRHWWEKK